MNDDRRLRPAEAVLRNLLTKHSSTVIGKMYGVSHEAVRLWCKKYGFEIRDIRPVATVLCEGCGEYRKKVVRLCACGYRKEKEPVAIIHGTSNAYNHRGCRCAECRKGHSDRAKQRIKRREQMLAYNWNAVKHGSAATYQNHGCRCGPCFKAAKVQHREWRKRKAQQKRESA